MDSFTQIVLGASVGVAVMGRRTAAWKAALWGGVAGLLPDLDVLVDHGDAVLNMVRHRAESHSLIYLSLAAPLLAWPVHRLHGRRAPGGPGWLQVKAQALRNPTSTLETPQAGYARWCLAWWLALITHPLLDWMTIYGTQLWLPASREAFGLGSIFIIDAAYTLPLLVGVVWALVGRHRGLAANRWGLALATAYLAWSAAAQAWVLDHARQSLAAQGLPTTQVLATPAPLQTVLWRVVAIDGGRFHEGFYSLADRGRPVRFVAHDRGGELLARHAAHPQVARMARFSDGFYRLTLRDGRLLLADLRMGQQPHFVFEFDLGPASGVPEAAVNVGLRGDVGAGLRWLWRRLRGEDLDPAG